MSVLGGKIKPKINRTFHASMLSGESKVGGAHTSCWYNPGERAFFLPQGLMAGNGVGIT